ncbi:hypothetical protein GCM10009765_19540 [Fodinicola feengrottensis]|uniref:Uncharacterized protein n=1 Tax=Fodinicola feengrottensis TaxID=435914 RepID=A0ABN2GFT8_9ACTN
MTGWDGYAGWTGGVEIDTFGHQHWLREHLPPLSSVRSVAPQPRPVEPPPARIAAAIGQLRARGVQVGSRRDLLAWLVDGWERVQQDRPGFVLAAPALAIRIFASGALPDTEDRPAVTGRQLAEAVADHLNNPVLRPPVATVTLPRLPDALIVDRLNLFAADGIEDELRRPLERLVAGRPELAESVADATGRPSVPALAGLIWRDGLALQYAREAAGEVVLIAPAPYEGESLLGSDLAELARNSAIVQAEIGCLGFTHEIYSLEQKVTDDQRARQARQQAVAAGLAGADVRRAGAAARVGPVSLPAEDRTYTYREAVDAGRLPPPPVRQRQATARRRPRRPVPATTDS